MVTSGDFYQDFFIKKNLYFRKEDLAKPCDLTIDKVNIDGPQKERIPGHIKSKKGLYI